MSKGRKPKPVVFYQGSWWTKGYWWHADRDLADIPSCTCYACSTQVTGTSDRLSKGYHHGPYSSPEDAMANGTSSLKGIRAADWIEAGEGK